MQTIITPITTTINPTIITLMDIGYWPFQNWNAVGRRSVFPIRAFDIKVSVRSNLHFDDMCIFNIQRMNQWVNQSINQSTMTNNRTDQYLIFSPQSEVYHKYCSAVERNYIMDHSISRRMISIRRRCNARNEWLCWAVGIWHQTMMRIMRMDEHCSTMRLIMGQILMLCLLFYELVFEDDGTSKCTSSNCDVLIKRLTIQISCNGCCDG